MSRVEIFDVNTFTLSESPGPAAAVLALNFVEFSASVAAEQEMDSKANSIVSDAYERVAESTHTLFGLIDSARSKCRELTGSVKSTHNEARSASGIFPVLNHLELMKRRFKMGELLEAPTDLLRFVVTRGEGMSRTDRYRAHLAKQTFSRVIDEHNDDCAEDETLSPETMVDTGWVK